MSLLATADRTGEVDHGLFLFCFYLFFILMFGSNSKTESLSLCALPLLVYFIIFVSDIVIDTREGELHNSCATPSNKRLPWHVLLLSHIEVKEIGLKLKLLRDTFKCKLV